MPDKIIENELVERMYLKIGGMSLVSVGKDGIPFCVGYKAIKGLRVESIAKSDTYKREAGLKLTCMSVDSKQEFILQECIQEEAITNRTYKLKIIQIQKNEYGDTLQPGTYYQAWWFVSEPERIWLHIDDELMESLENCPSLKKCIPEGLLVSEYIENLAQNTLTQRRESKRSQEEWDTMWGVIEAVLKSPKRSPKKRKAPNKREEGKSECSVSGNSRKSYTPSSIATNSPAAAAVRLGGDNPAVFLPISDDGGNTLSVPRSKQKTDPRRPVAKRARLFEYKPTGITYNRRARALAASTSNRRARPLAASTSFFPSAGVNPGTGGGASSGGVQSFLNLLGYIANLSGFLATIDAVVRRDKTVSNDLIAGLNVYVAQGDTKGFFPKDKECSQLIIRATDELLKTASSLLRQVDLTINNILDFIPGLRSNNDCLNIMIKIKFLQYEVLKQLQMHASHDRPSSNLSSSASP